MQLEIKHATVRYSNSDKILDNIDLNITEGQFLGITGKAGCGKTTLLETIAGFHKPESGFVLLDGQNIYEKRFVSQSFRKRLQIVFQFPENQFFESDIWNEIGFGLKNISSSPEEKERKTIEAMLAVGLDINEMKNVSPFALSGGQKRRLALACAIVVSPEILLLDEPFSGLDGDGQNQIISILKDLHRNGTTILMVSHDPNVLSEVADKIVVLDAGKIQFNDIPSRVFADKYLCDKLGIGQPETKITADLIGLDLDEDLTYSNFIKKLEKKYLAAHD